MALNAPLFDLPPAVERPRRPKTLYAPDVPVSKETVARIYWYISRMGYDDVLHCNRYVLTYLYLDTGYPFYRLSWEGSDCAATAEVRDEYRLPVLRMAIAEKLARLGWLPASITVGKWEAANVPVQLPLDSTLAPIDISLYTKQTRKCQLVDIYAHVGRKPKKRVGE